MAEPHEPLTERELEIVRLLGTGAGNKEIATQLLLSPNTVKVHLRNIFTKLQAQSRTEVTVIAVRNGWISLGETPTALQGYADNSAAVSDRPALERPQRSQLVVPIAPNPQPIPDLAIWQRLGLLACICGTLLLTVLMLPTNRSGSAQSIDPLRIGPSQARNALLARGEASRWYLRAPLPVARARSLAVTVGKSIYVIGGEVNQSVSGDVLLFYPITDTWTILDTPKPTPVANATAAALNTLIYVAGGTNILGKSTASFEVFDTSSRKWQSLPPLPVAVAGHSMAAYKDQVYVFGGTTEKGTTSDSWKYDPRSGSWQAIASMPVPRSLTAAAVASDHIYVVGGYADGRELAICESYDPRKDVWNRCSSLTVPRGSLGLVRVGSSLFAIGGGISGFIGFNERYDVVNDRWSALETPLANDWQNLAITATESEFYVFGGYSNGERLALSYVYEVFTNRAYIPVFGSQGTATRTP